MCIKGKRFGATLNACNPMFFEGAWAMEEASSRNFEVELWCTYMQESSMGAWGFVNRDSNGDVVSSSKGKVNHLLGAFQAKIIACLHGI